MDSYNGYSETERNKKYDVYKKLRDAGSSELPLHIKKCQLCGYDRAPLVPHSEDYSKPYLWNPPAEYMVCRSCHGWIHKRFEQSENWQDFVQHVKRGGYATEFANSAKAKAERKMAAAHRAQGVTYKWLPFPGRTPSVGKTWWEQLTIDPESKTAKWARPRP